MRLGGCVEESRRGAGARARRRLLPLRAGERNVRTMWRVFVCKDLIAIPETIDAIRCIGEV